MNTTDVGCTTILGNLFERRLNGSNSFIEWSTGSRSILREVESLGPDFLGGIIRSALRSQSLRNKCETHQLVDYLVVYEDPFTGARMRLHLATDDHLQRVHDHRFSFSSLILTGRYQHSLYGFTRDVYAMSAPSQAAKHQDRHHSDPQFDGCSSEDLFHLQLIREETAGNSYTMHHSQLHTVFTTKNTVSLVLRGNAAKQRSLIFDQHGRKLWWRFSRVDECTKRIASKIMTDDKINQVVSHLTAMGVIA